ncbi:DUF3459 domain-containing protein, partial [Streptomyces asoensis]|uniref:DUF3459 domain-containing protein n=1 Tax=Streptomyces asoensis TaxID=249586 RepID=UPI0033D60D84
RRRPSRASSTEPSAGYGSSRRRGEAALGDGVLEWLPAPAGVLAFRRTPGLICVVNLAAEPAVLPEHDQLLLASGPLDSAGRLPRDTAVWLRE